MYSDMSKRISSMPRMKANCFATSVLPTPVGPENRKEPIGLSGFPRPDRALLFGGASRADGGFLAEHDALEVAIDRAQAIAVVGGDARGRDARDLGHDLLDLVAGDRLL